MADTRYVFGVLRTGEVIDEIALQGVSMTSKLNDWGSFNGTFALDQTGKKNLDLIGATVPGQCFIACERDDVPIWFGIVWSNTYQSQSKTCQLAARELAAYPEKRRILNNLSYDNVDQGTIFLNLWNHLQSTPESDLGIVIPGAFVTGVLADLEVKAKDLKVYSDVMSSIADGDTGFDWKIATSKDSSGNYVHTLEVGYPTLGSDDPALLTFEYPGNIINYYETGSATEAGTHVILTGSGSDDETITSTYTHSDMISGGQWMRYDVVVPRRDVSNPTILAALARQQGPLRRPPMNIVKAFVRASADPAFGNYSLGDACRMYFDDPRHEGITTVDTRITSWNYRPTSDEGIEEVELIFEGDELNE